MLPAAPHIIPSDLPTVLLALHDQSFVAALATSLAASCRVVGVAASWDEFHDALENLEPSVALVDILVGTDSMMPYLGRLATKYTPTRFILYTAVPDDIVVDLALVSGVAGVLEQSGNAEPVSLAVEATARRAAWPAGVGIPALLYSDRPHPRKRITVRESQVLELLWRGLTPLGIGAILKRSIKTVEGHVLKLRKAYGLDRGEAAPWEASRPG